MNCMFANQEYCSSGCESGWTLYLEHSSISPYASYNQENDEFLEGRKNEVAKRLDEDDEDMSMVSDASSGPPHLHEDEEGYGGGSNNVDTNGCFYHYPIIDDPLCKNSDKNKDKKRRRNAQDQQSSLLDDTASSPFFDFSDKSFTLTRSQPTVESVLEYSQGYSSTQFEVRPPYQEQYDFFQSTEPGNQLQQNQCFEGKRW